MTRNICRLVSPSFTAKSRKAELFSLLANSSFLLQLNQKSGYVNILLLRYAVIVDNHRSRRPVDPDMPVLAVLNVVQEKAQDASCSDRFLVS